MSWKSILKPEASVMAGIAEIAVVYGIYNLNIGNTSVAQASDPNHPVLESSRKKAGYTALAVVAGLFLVTKDANGFILGCGTIIAMECSYRHAIMANPASGQLENPNPTAAYMPAENVVAFPYQGQTG
jgi:hypothetical protein